MGARRGILYVNLRIIFLLQLKRSFRERRLFNFMLDLFLDLFLADPL